MPPIHSCQPGIESANPLKSFPLNNRRADLWESVWIKCGFFVVSSAFYSQLFCEDLVFTVDLFS